MRARLAAAFVLLLTFVLPAAAEDGPGSSAVRNRVIELQSELDILSSYGLVVLEPDRSLSATAGTVPTSIRPRLRRREAVLRRAGANRWEAFVSLKEADLEPSAKVTAVGVTASGAVVAGAVQWVLPPAQRFAKPELRCNSEAAAERFAALGDLSKEALERLIEIRRRRRSLLSTLYRKIKSPQLLAKLNETEQHYSLEGSLPLSMDTDLEEFIARVGALRAFIEGGREAPPLNCDSEGVCQAK